MVDEDRVGKILSDWCECQQRGEAESRDELIGAHPELEDALREGFAALDLVDLAFEDEAVQPALPDRVGPYRVIQELGVGGMGTVYLAEAPANAEAVAADTRVALKVIHPHLLSRAGFFKRFLREADLGKRVVHANVVSTLDADATESEGRTAHFLVMEYVEGKTLRDLLTELGTVPEALIREIARQLTAGLVAIHEAGVVHRDLKPENVLITDEHVIKLMDLGVARLVDPSVALTKQGQFAGSLPYAAPEQFGGEEIGPQSDLYSLGVLLYELATGVNPFRRDETGAVMQAHLEHIPQLASERNPDVSQFLSEMLTTLLAKKTEDRFESAAMLNALLEEGERSAWWAERQRGSRREGARSLVVPVRRETSLYGREADLKILHEEWKHAESGNGRMVLLEGEAGIGKSRLVDAYLASLPHANVHVLYGSYSPSGGLGGLLDSISEHFGSASLEEALRPYLTVTPTLVPGFAALIRREVAVDGAAPLEGDAVHAAFVHLMQGLAAEKPLVWIVEDLHFATSDGRKFVLSLARALEGRRILLIGTTRPEVPEEELVHFSRLENFRRMSLGRLSPRDVILLLQDTFHSEKLATKLGGRIALKSDGVPFFIFEMIRGLRQGQFITELPDGSSVMTKEIEEIEVPSSVRDLIEARLRDLSDEDRDLLDVAAVDGFQFDPDLLGRVLDWKRVHVLRRLAAMERKAGVVRAFGDAYRFDHHQMQEVVYGDLSSGLREETHALVAEALEARAGAADKEPKELNGALCVDMCEHYFKGAKGEKALRYLEAALDHLKQGFLNDQALALANRALQVPNLLQGGRRLRALLRKNDVLELVGRRQAQEEVLAQARALADETDDRASYAQVERAVGILLWATGRSEEAKAHFERCLAIAREIGDRRFEAKVTGSLGIVLRALGRYEEAKAHHERHLAIAHEIGDRQSEAGAMLNLGRVFCVMGRYEEAKAHFERRLAIAGDMGDRQGEGSATGNLGTVFESQARYDEAREHYERHLAIAREIGDRRGECTATAHLGALFGALGRHAEAEAHFERSLAIAREIGDREGEGIATGNLGLVFSYQGRYGEAREHHEKQLALAREIGDRQGEARAIGNLGNVLQNLGRHEEAREHYERHLAISREIGDRQGEVIATGRLGGVFWGQGRYAEAREHIERHLALAREIGDRHGEGIALVNLGSLLARLGAPEAGRERLQASRDLCREIGARSDEGMAVASLGALAQDLGNLSDAEQFYREALDLRRDLDDQRGVAAMLLSLGALLARAGRPDEATTHLSEAEEMARKVGEHGPLALATCHLALLPDGDAAAATDAHAAHEDRLEHYDRIQARVLLWQATSDYAHLQEAKRLLDHLVEHAPVDYRESMLTNVRLHREIMEAWGEHGENAEEQVDD